MMDGAVVTRQAKPAGEDGSAAGLVLRDISISIDDAALLDGLDLTVPPGDVVTVMGPSGSGKSTLLAYVAGFLDKAFTARGDVLLDGARITALPVQQRRLGILFQDDLLFPHLSVGANLAFGLDAGVGGRRARRERVEEALAQAGLGGFYERDPATLSGGQRARAALMRTLLASPRALLLDEPFSKLDRPLRKEIRDFVFSHARAIGLPTLLVTHDHEDADAAGGPVVTLVV
ncbi:MAG: ABC-type uptake system ATPase component YnjD [Saliniramus fredricksonii]|uniref:ABC-type uptake system ATPase component YnjD n=2 Tax=Saliniramus fredricksonii TaxID=1653334 RepID=A0A0P8A0V6_9HYPH|nr:MAG: ABC-type uptake system ATPase component YnjD [Saliniramus fredricksonii]SCC81840.1 putative thiamine transport system ATP-binding protein [Saliniramus fredricksonii]